MSDFDQLDPYFFHKSKLNMTGEFDFSGERFEHTDVIEALEPLLTEERVNRIADVVSRRSLQFVPVLENIYDRGNISAVMRSAEAFGFLRCHIIESENAKFKAANRVTKGADKWLDVQVHRTAEQSVMSLKQQGFQVFATHLEASRPIETVDFTQPTAIVLGNEKDGVSPEMVDLCDGNVILPMQGFSQSFNISVAAALVFYHVFHARKNSSLGRNADLSEQEQEIVKANYYLRCLDNPERLLFRWRRQDTH